MIHSSDLFWHDGNGVLHCSIHELLSVQHSAIFAKPDKLKINAGTHAVQEFEMALREDRNGFAAGGKRKLLVFEGEIQYTDPFDIIDHPPSNVGSFLVRGVAKSV